MSLVVPPGYGLASIYLSGDVGTSPYVTTMGLDIGAAGTTLIDAANNVLASYIDAFQGITNSDLRIDRVSLFVGDLDSPGSVDSTGPGAQGLREIAMAPTAMSAIARKVTEELGRAGRGRMFLPGILADEDVNESGRIEGGSRDIFDAKCLQFLDNLANADPTMELLPVLLHSESSPITTPTAIEALITAPLVGWIRGRIR